MAIDSAPQGAPVTNKETLIAYMASGCKPKEKWRIGTEHEKFAYDLQTLRPLEYGGENGIKALLEGLRNFGWLPVFEDGHLIALKMDDGSSITLEPAGQVELSGAPLETVHQTCKEVGLHLNQVKAIAAKLGIGFIGLGYQPKWSTDTLPWMPKNRYEIMRRYMPTRGTLGLDMMQATCTVQVNLDFDSEATMVEMFRISLALQPIATALWANSPFRNGAPSGFLSYRSHIWTDTDPDRCGMLPFVFDEGFGFERYVEYMLDVPMYFVYRDGHYIDASGQSFRDFLAGKLPALPGEYPTLSDWEDHLTVAFPEVRLKRYLEMRGADGGPWNRLCALPAFWVGLLYDEAARAKAWDIVHDWSREDHAFLRREVPKTALATAFRGGDVGDIALDVLEIAHGGLERRAKMDGVGRDETHFLNPLFQIAESGLTPADDLLMAFERRWKGNIDPIFKEYSY
ncbi:glutamate--cysteine ligase [Varunaivibrio sulfuroxidans]|uniref:Glutamate--cysteine ligase n=1 Tax=Varunaivibrio sulfuroxidans TaxID=1773489 RepID=A0A4R3J5R6_9PROT|nr:glutamate--cysteine ligase [Varunaivibrio sulfuroxidans]TCS60642.1 glutamate--cysteine ligase [Varunaivibrio sulfuroxidans]WES30131.1 glutamate--cysteine ligase [Varunaivibrio sulfuroxidans]